MKESAIKKSADINRQEIEESKQAIEKTQVIIERAVELASEIYSKLCSRNMDANDRRMSTTIDALAHVQDAIELLSSVIGYDTATINIDKITLRKD